MCQMIFTSDQVLFDKSQKMMKENLIVDTFQSKGKNFYISSRQNMLSGWKIIQVIPEERLFEEVDQKIKWNSIFLLGALILVVSFSIYYTKKIIEPLEEFCKKISHTKGDQLQIINLEHMKLTREIANVISVILAIVFAYVVNSKFVFLDKCETLKDHIRPFCKFVGARLSTMVIEVGGVWFFAEIVHLNDMVGKLIIQFVVMALNYVFSKFLVFTSGRK